MILSGPIVAKDLPLIATDNDVVKLPERRACKI
jgi:hypothetical protein